MEVKLINTFMDESARCNLLYEISADKTIFDAVIVSYKPLEDCPKPKNMRDYVYLYNHIVNEKMGKIKTSF